MRLRILVAAIALTLVPATAGAAPFGPAEEAAYAEAAAYWQMTPDHCTSIVKEQVPEGTLDLGEERTIFGRATQPDLSLPPQPCVLQIVEGFDDDPSYLCGLLRHEYGHLLGYGHGAPEMAPLMGDISNLPGCPGYTPVLSEAEILRLQWSKEWRETVAWCKEMPAGKYRRHCWRHARRQHRAISRLPAD